MKKINRFVNIFTDFFILRNIEFFLLLTAIFFYCHMPVIRANKFQPFRANTNLVTRLDWRYRADLRKSNLNEINLSNTKNRFVYIDVTCPSTVEMNSLHLLPKLCFFFFFFLHISYHLLKCRFPVFFIFLQHFQLFF